MEMAVMAVIKDWMESKRLEKQKQRERLAHLAPLRTELTRSVLKIWGFALPAVAALIIWAGWPLDGPVLIFALLAIVYPALTLSVAIVFLRKGGSTKRSDFATAMLFQSIVFAAAFSEAVVIKSAGKGFVEGYPQYGGVLILTILLSGLLVGEFYVGAWTLICCLSLQFAMHAEAPWSVNVGWAATYVAAGWLAIQFSRHMEQFYETSRVAEEKQRGAIVAERTRFARDIHDTLAQGFTGIMMQLNAAEQRLSEVPEARAHIEKARQLAGESLEEARRSVSALRNTALANGTLLDAIAQIGNKLTADSGVHLETKLEGQPYALQEEQESALLRIAQEALTNSVRHAGAGTIHVVLRYRTGSVVLELRDNGRGMSGLESSGLGLEGMRQRAREIGAEINIVSEPASGTRITVAVSNA
jgi:signal transduction histidine kinase